MQDMIEIGGHRGKTLAMREPVGVQGDENAGANREQAETDPGAKQRQHFAPLRRGARPLRAGQAIDDAAK